MEGAVAVAVGGGGVRMHTHRQCMFDVEVVVWCGGGRRVTGIMLILQCSHQSFDTMPPYYY